MGFCKNTLLLATTVALVAACSDSSGPSEFNPSGMSSDLSLVTSAGSDPSFAAMTAAFDDMAEATGSSGAAVAAAGLFLREPRSEYSTEQMPSVMRALVRDRHAPALNASVGAIPPEVAGTTYEYDSDAGHWVAGSRSGAPANGVRFVLYQVDAIGAVVTPFSEIGYADLTDLSTGSSAGARLVVVVGGTTFADYAASATGDESDGHVSVDGYVGAGSNRMTVDFDADFQSSGADNVTFTVDSDLVFPSHSVAIGVHLVGSSSSNGEGQLQFTETLESSNGRLDISGAWATNASPSLEIHVNGSTYAHLAGYTEGDLVGNDGRVLTQEEREALFGAFIIGEATVVIPVYLVAPMIGLASAIPL